MRKRRRTPECRYRRRDDRQLIEVPWYFRTGEDLMKVLRAI